MCLVTQSCPTICDSMNCSPPGSFIHGDLPKPGIETGSPALRADSLLSGPPGKPKKTGLVSQPLLQGIFPTQELKRGLLHCRQILYQWKYQGSPRKLEWVAYPFFSGSSQPRNWNGVSCITGGFFRNWALRELDLKCYNWRAHVPQLGPNTAK